MSKKKTTMEADEPVKDVVVDKPSEEGVDIAKRILEKESQPLK